MDPPRGVTRRTFLRASAGTTWVVASGAAFPAVRAKIASAGEERSRALPVRDAYSVDPSITYLNHASIGTIPVAVREALVANITTQETNPWLYQWGPAWADAVDASHTAAAGFLGVGADDIAINHNTTEAFSTLAHGLHLEPGDEVLFSSLNHIGASATWRAVARRRGFTVRSFEFPIADAVQMTSVEILELHARQIRDSTRVLVFPHVDNMIGLRHPVAEIARAARDRGVEFVAVDGAQATGTLPVEVGAMGVDVYATSAHKGIQAPKGIGLLAVSRTARERIDPAIVTWGQARWADSARKFTDYGTRNLPALLALHDCFRFQDAIGRERLERHLRSLRRRLRDRVDAEHRLTWRSPRSWDGGAALALIGVGKDDTGAVADALFRQHGIVVRPFAAGPATGLRVSFHAMNSAQDIDRFIEKVVPLIDTI